MSTYFARKVEIDGILFDSQAEARRYRELCLLESAHKIIQLDVHPVYELAPAFRWADEGGKGHLEKAITYTPDFDYVENGVTVAEDVKHFGRDGRPYLTPVFRLKLKLFRARYPGVIFRIVDA